MYCISPIEYTGVFLCTEVTEEEATFITIVCTSGIAPSAKIDSIYVMKIIRTL